MSGKYLLDTCTLIGLQKQTPESFDLLSQKGVYLSECAISVITYIEFIGFYGVDNKTCEQLKYIANQFTQYPLDDNIRDKAIAIRQKHKIKLPDALILATAKTHQLTLLTLDDKLAKFYQ
ncbi:PIN domain-containing protein [Moraxella sp. Tifton1]|uniref:PIN domain-containing protein n=1 Tax=Moraxella oculi TaxID=2940516 RepID=UPI00201114B3|nr:PIN domain-containing protein [Moraxella sp. Tifton1]MCL1624016.1 PIN domain-containing protein [Moraxella sp. Tifton1]